MKGIDRSNLSCRTLLFLFVLLGTPMAARSATLEDSAKELARKIASALPAEESVSVEMRNISSLTLDEVSVVEQALKAELANLKFHLATNGAATVNLRITLSENTKSLLWSAEIIQGAASKAILMEVSRNSEFRIASYRMPVVLRSVIIWEGPKQILDATTASEAGGLTRLVLLLPDGLEIEDTPGSTMSTVKIPSTGTTTRDPRGRLDLDGNIVSAVLPTRVCTVNLDTIELMECHTPVARDLSRDGGQTEVVPRDLLSLGKGTEMLMPQNGCGAFLATGSGDYTQLDSVQAFSVKPAGIAISNKLDFPGPVLALQGSSGASRAIVRNLRTGNYEAYRLSCGQ